MYMCTPLCVRVCVCVLVCTCRFVDVYMCVHVCMLCACVCMYVCLCVCMCVLIACIHVVQCMYIYLHVWLQLKARLGEEHEQHKQELKLHHEKVYCPSSHFPTLLHVCTSVFLLRTHLTSLYLLGIFENNFNFVIICVWSYMCNVLVSICDVILNWLT